MASWRTFKECTTSLSSGQTRILSRWPISHLFIKESRCCQSSQPPGASGGTPGRGYCQDSDLIFSPPLFFLPVCQPVLLLSVLVSLCCITLLICCVPLWLWSFAYPDSTPTHSFGLFSNLFITQQPSLLIFNFIIKVWLVHLISPLFQKYLTSGLWYIEQQLRVFWKIDIIQFRALSF